MLQASWYLLKVVLCSGIMLGYYWLMLRNKIYHHYNRFFLLLSVILSLVLPLVQINIFHAADTAPSQAIQLLQAVTAGDDFISSYVPGQERFYFTTTQWLSVAYMLVSGVLLLVFLRVLWMIRTLIYTYKGQVVERFFFISTRAKGTPFSFLNYIFWNEDIDLESDTGKQIFRHEVAHVQERHSLDKLLLSGVLIFCWCNPFFWLIRKELSMIHEFIADKKAVEDSDTASFAAMILQAAYPGHRFDIVNHFFYSPIKRRLIMLTKNQTPRVSYISRIMVLPLAALIVAAFTFKPQAIPVRVQPAASLTVVIDPGHGGLDAGAMGADGTTEKALNLAIAQKVKQLNPDDNIRIVLTRETDAMLSPTDRTAIALREKADLFISIHMDAQPKGDGSKRGLSVFVAREEFANTGTSKVLASALLNEFSKGYALPVNNNPKQRQVGIAVLQTLPCPSVLIEAGYITNEADLAYLRTDAGQETIAQFIHAAIRNYSRQPRETAVPVKAGTIVEEPLPVNTPLPQRTPAVVPAPATETVVPEAIKPGVAQVLAAIAQVPREASAAKAGKSDAILPEAIYVLNGKQIKKTDFNTINLNELAQIDVIKPAEAVKMYGDAGSKGAVLITTKPAAQALQQQQRGLTEKPIKGLLRPDPVFTKVEHEAEFPGGEPAWQAFLQKNVNPLTPVDEGWKKGTYKIRLQFIVDIDGSISGIQVLDYAESKTAAHCINAMGKSPVWKPAIQNGHMVKSYHTKTITFVVTED